MFKFLHVFCVFPFICKCSDYSCKLLWGKNDWSPAFMGTWFKGETDCWKCYLEQIKRRQFKGQYKLQVLAKLQSTKSARKPIGKEAETACAFSSPQQSQKREPYKDLDDFDETAVTNKVHEFYTVRRQLPTITNLHAALKENIATLTATLCSSLASNGKRQTTTEKSLLKSPLSSPRDWISTRRSWMMLVLRLFL